ncbi:hypothetical protein TraAM80_07865 [Trypanosoma rangeli]|uniref:Uncharacterized protein n=1 Tax=Trypanosoma rangeli TaxID=5698 RepID=A0A422N3H8_TRYRA|nr:uncharacterized protein TraAM80_07865 [Trypanosoma rangeli]RNF00001.1 hypothetical protein TraAM80_07865 [Trypanosoma rangeli]|eukprot:RNF00001.1 hypothetical protein TraAM80_07865 [Trypanosoma rangeli]
MYRELDALVSTEALETERKVSQRRLYLITFVVFSVVAGGSFACVVFGISEIASHDSTLMNDGLGEVMTVLGICFTLPCVFCVVVFASLALGLSCCPSNPRFSTLLVIGLTLISFVTQQILCDVFLFRFIGFPTAAALVADVCVAASYIFLHARSFYVPTVLTVVVFVGKTAALWGVTFTRHADEQQRHYQQQQQLSSSGLFAMLALTVSIVQLPLYITETREWSGRDNNVVAENTIVGNFNNNFNLLLLHLLNSLDIFTVYSSVLFPGTRKGSLRTVPEPFQILISIIVSVAFVGNNVGVIHLFYARDGVECAELMFLPKRLRDAINQWSSTDANGSHKRRILQYMLLLIVVCDVPLLAVRTQLWWRDHQMLSIFLIKNIKAIFDMFMVVLRVGRSLGSADRVWDSFAEN